MYAVIGQGYVGLPLALELTRAGMPVVGFDTSEGIVAALNSGRSHVDDVADDHVQAMVDAGYRCTSDPAVLSDASTIVVCVPTPLTLGGDPDMRAVEAAGHYIATHMRSGTLVVLESTSYPGTTEDLFLPILEQSGLRLDVDFHLAFSPERVDPGNSAYGLKNTPKVVGGVSEASGDAAAAFYETFVDRVVRTRGAREAETAKLLENTYRHVNIALVNELARFCAEANIDVWDVINAASTKPFGFQPFYPGPGVGGHCIPIDPKYLSFEVRRQTGNPFRFVDLASEINDSMPAYVVARIQRIVNADRMALKDSRILLLGVTYKADIADQRESPAIAVAELLALNGANVRYHDPFVAEWSINDTVLRSVSDLESEVAEADVVVLLQVHSAYDPDLMAETARRFFDTRGATSSKHAVRL